MVGFTWFQELCTWFCAVAHSLVLPSWNTFFEFQCSRQSKNMNRHQKQIKAEPQVTNNFWERAWKHSWLIIDLKLWSTVKMCEHLVLKNAICIIYNNLCEDNLCCEVKVTVLTSAPQCCWLYLSFSMSCPCQLSITSRLLGDWRLRHGWVFGGCVQIHSALSLENWPEDWETNLQNRIKNNMNITVAA